MTATPTSFSVVIIDDNPVLINSYVAFFQQKNVDVNTAQTGPEGIALAKEKHPDIMLIDLMLPGMDGISVMRALKADDTTKDIPLIAITALLNDEEKAACMEAGAVFYAPKADLEADDLFRVMQKHVSKHSE